MNARRAGRELKRSEFAVSRGISPAAWSHIIGKNGELTSLGQRRREQFLAQNMLLAEDHPGVASGPVPQSMPVAADYPTQAQALDLSLRRPRPEAVPLEANAEHIRQWQTLTQEQREQIGLSGFAERNQLDQGMLSSLVRADGTVTGQGLKLLHRDRLKAATHEMT